MKLKIEILLSADGTCWAIGNEETGSCWPNRKTLEVEEKPSSVAAAVQMEVAEAMEALRMDQTQ